MNKQTTNTIFIILAFCCVISQIQSKKIKDGNGGVHSTDYLETKIDSVINSEVAGEISKTFLKTSKSRSRLGIKDANGNVNDVEVNKVEHDADDGSKHAKLKETINGIPIFGENIIVHIDENGKVYKKDEDSTERKVLIDTKPKIEEKAAIECATKHSNPKGDLKVRFVSSELMILPKEGKDYLTYVVDLDLKENEHPSDPIYFVSAVDCSIIHEFDNLQGEVEGYNSNHGYSILSNKVRTSTTGPNSDSAVENCYQNALKVDKMISEFLKRNSWNNNGAVYKVNANYSRNYNNAYWTSTSNALVFGNGDGTMFSNLCKDLHVVAHEIGHAIVTADSGLVYKNESGALNESFADCLGAATYWYFHEQKITNETFMIGATSYTPNVSGDGLRNMANPSSDGSSKDCYSKKYTGGSDNGGVHWNSGIGNLAFYLLVQGGKHPNACTSHTCKGIGMEKSIKILYRANKLYYTENTTFSEARKHWEQAASDLYGAEEIYAVGCAMASVGVGSLPTSGSSSDASKTSSSSGSTNTARYIHLQAPNSGDHPINVSQIACYDKSGNNVAKGKPATASSTHSATPNVSMIVDGNLSSRSHPNSFHSGKSTGDWVKIDLQQDIAITKCVLYNRNDCCQFRIKDMVLSLRNSANDVVASHTIQSTENTITINFKKDRYVKLTMASTGDAPMNVSQIVCFNKDGVNLTKGKNVTASSESHGTKPSQLVDGQERPRNHPESFHSANSNNDWAKIDLGASYEVAKCKIYLRNDCCQDRIKGAKLEILNTSGTPVKSHIFKSNEKIQEISFQKSRYVKLQAPSSGDNPLQVSQLACYNLSGENVTQNKPVTYSSKHDALTQIKLNDGYMGTRNFPDCFHSRTAINDWIMIDMQADFAISKCVYYNRKDCCQNRIQGANLSLLDSDKKEVAKHTFTKTDAKIDVPF